ncbi:hypothetical protein [Hyphomonas oceanitis]|uniref:KAP NTPase domain-containing protein n=1 Tax=Hyphomonas oceanitis SCH89 TaxID=1280953 RepID=A0A059G8N0_9PROT|nr:hypothetical protein [Hyphomonas oceanitis]KDA03212.1 hypothetical protein HOC_06238 [Hyphomonas oceanitis SCH89]
METAEFIRTFLEQETDDVSNVTGAWGTGKTHVWHTTVSNFTNANDTLKRPRERYAYVSLFGIDSLDALKLRIFEELHPFSKAPKRAGVNPVDWISPVWRKHFKHAEGLPVVGQFATALTPMYFSAVNKAVICFDDLERRSLGLSLTSVFGLAQYLKDNRNCRVFFLLNNHELTEEDRSTYESYFEKTFDSSVRLEPTTSDCVEIAFNDDPSLQILKEYAARLPVNNIRILKKIRRGYVQLEKIVGGLRPEVKQQIAGTLPLLAWCHLQGENAPDLSFALETGSYKGISDRDKWTPTQRNWSRLIESYGYRMTDNLDSAIAKYVVDGYVDSENFLRAAHERHEQALVDEAHGAYQAAWGKFHDAFSDDEEEIVSELKEAFLDGVEHLGVQRLNSLVLFLSDLDRSDDVKEIVQAFITAHSKKPRKFWDPAEYSDFHTKWHPAVTEELQRRYSSLIENYDIIETLELLGKHEISPNEAVRRLSHVSTEEFVSLLKNTNPTNHRNVLRGATHFELNTHSPEDNDLRVRLSEALSIIAAESKIKALMLANWGVQPKGPTE